MIELLALLSVGLLAYAAISRRTANTVLTAPMFFTAFGLLIAWLVPTEHGLHGQGEWIHLLAEITLALVLFTAATASSRRSSPASRSATPLAASALRSSSSASPRASCSRC